MVLICSLNQVVEYGTLKVKVVDPSMTKYSSLYALVQRSLINAPS